MESKHIQCKQGCTEVNNLTLVLLSCKVCIYHATCVPTLCRCERHTAEMQQIPFAKLGCSVENCKRQRTAHSSALCAEHATEICASLCGKIKILGTMSYKSVRSYLENHADLQQCRGDLLHLAEQQLFEKLNSVWQVLNLKEREIVYYVSKFLADQADCEIDDVKGFVAKHNFPPQAVSVLYEDAKAQRHGWRDFGNTRIGPVGLQKRFKNADELYVHLKHQSVLTHSVDRLVALYDEAADHMNTLILTQRATLVQNSSLLYICPGIQWDSLASAYWKAHVAPGLSIIIQNPGQGAVKSQAVHG